MPGETEGTAARSGFEVDIAMLGLVSAVIATVAAPVAALRLRRSISGVKVKFTLAKLPLPKISSAVRSKIDELTAYASTPDWAGVLFGLSFLPSVDLVSIDIRNTLDRPSGSIEILAPDVRIWHYGEYQQATHGNLLVVGPIEPNSLITITAFIGIGGPCLEVFVREDGREVGHIRGS